AAVNPHHHRQFLLGIGNRLRRPHIQKQAIFRTHQLPVLLLGHIDSHTGKLRTKTLESQRFLHTTPRCRRTRRAPAQIADRCLRIRNAEPCKGVFSIAKTHHRTRGGRALSFGNGLRYRRFSRLFFAAGGDYKCYCQQHGVQDYLHEGFSVLLLVINRANSKSRPKKKRLAVASFIWCGVPLTADSVADTANAPHPNPPPPAPPPPTQSRAGAHPAVSE